MLTSGGMSIHCGQHYRKACKELKTHAKSWKIASANICAHATRVLVKPTPYHSLSFAHVTVFAWTDITFLMMRFVERGHRETCFSFDCKFINKLYAYWVHFCWQFMHLVTFCMHFFSPFPFQHITFIGIFARENFLWNSFTCYF